MGERRGKVIKEHVCIKDLWTKTKLEGRIEGGRWEWVEWGKMVVEKWRQLYMLIIESTR